MLVGKQAGFSLITCYTRSYLSNNPVPHGWRRNTKEPRLMPGRHTGCLAVANPSSYHDMHSPFRPNACGVHSAAQMVPSKVHSKIPLELYTATMSPSFAALIQQ